MARRRKAQTAAADPATSEPAQPEISEAEQWRIIQETGILQQLQKGPEPQTQVQPAGLGDDDSDNDEGTSFADELLDALLVIMPFCFLLTLMEVLIHQQYGHKATFKDVFDRLASGAPILGLFVFYTLRYKARRVTQILMFVLSLAAGPRLIWLVNNGSWIVNMKQCPPIATLWIYTIVQLDLGPSVVSLAMVGGWFWWSGYKLTFK